MDMVPSNAILDVEQVASLLRCSTKTVEEKARRGTLPGLKFGDGWVFPSEALLAHLNQMALKEALVRGQPSKPAGVSVPVAKPIKRGPVPLPSLT